jgi:ketol-acid reductoisomerase
MKKIIMILMIAIAASTAALGQAKMSKDSKVESMVIAMEKQSWQEWKNKNATWFQTNLSEDFLSVHNSGVENKASVVKTIAADCDVKSLSLDNIKFVMLNNDTAMMTYAASQDAVCSGSSIPANVLVAVVYVKRGGKWMQALYTETPAAK